MSSDTARPAKAEAKQFIPGLSSIRYFFATIVVLYHSAGTLGIPKRFIHDCGFGNIMALFFVISGFIMFHCYPKIATRQQLGNFWAARIARIWPLHAMALVFALIIVPWSELFYFTPTLSEKIQTAITNLTMVHAWIPFPASYASYNSVTWSISVEFFFYLTFPLVLMSFRNSWRRWLLGASALTVLVIVLCWAVSVPGFKNGYSGVTTSGFFHVNPLVRWIEFLLGMAMGLVYEHRDRWAWSKIQSYVFWTVAEALSIVLFIANMFLAARLGGWALSNFGAGADAWLQHSGALLTAALMVIVLAQDRGGVSRICAWRPLIILGESSYALYILHDPILRRLQESGHPFGWLPSWAQFPVFLGLLTALSVLTWKHVEIPARQWIMGKWKAWSANRKAKTVIVLPIAGVDSISAG